MEQSTDWGMRRRGAFRDQLTATERCLDAGIAPRWQLFLTKRCLAELDDGRLYALAAAAELRSEHPLGKAVVRCWRAEHGGGLNFLSAV